MLHVLWQEFFLNPNSKAYLLVLHVCMLVVLKAPLICFVVNKMMQKNTSAGILIALDHAIALAKAHWEI